MIKRKLELMVKIKASQRISGFFQRKSPLSHHCCKRLGQFVVCAINSSPVNLNKTSLAPIHI